jgi:antitoxin component YwqK of YwqJK toxin-antitoxin module
MKFHTTNISKLLAVFIFTLTTQVNGQTPDSNQVNETGQKTGYWTIIADDGSHTKEEGNYKEGRKDGLWKAYYPDGKLKHEITYTEGIAKGPARFYYKDGSLWEEGNWQEHCWVGDYRLYHPTGNAAYQFHYNSHGKRVGEQRYFYPDGTLKYKGVWDNGAITGQLEVYDDKGQLAQVRNYKDGSFEKTLSPKDLMPENQTLDSDLNTLPFHGTGHYSQYKKDGVLYRKGYFREGVLYDGEEFVYDNQGELRQIRVFENGKMIKLNPVVKN